MKKEFIPYEQALDLKQLGFDESCFLCYSKEGELSNAMTLNKTELNDIGFILAPLYQQAFDFFREKYGLWQIVIQNTDKDWTYDIIPIIGMIDYKLFDVFEKYGEAKLACLIKLIEITKSK